MSHPRVLVSTAGTSILTNLQGIDGDFERWLSKQPEGELGVLRSHREILEDAVACARRGAFDLAGERLASIPGSLRVSGAEASSVRALESSPWSVSIEEHVLLHSDTDEGRNAAKAVKGFLSARTKKSVRLAEIAGLQAKNLSEYRVKGLRNLVRILSGEVQRAGGPTAIAISVTGGFKAQVAVAALFGQIFGVRTLYLYETFPDFIELPPMPVTLDLSAALEQLDILREGSLTGPELKKRFGNLTESNADYARFRCFLDEEPVRDAGTDHYFVSALGQIALDWWHMRPQVAAGGLPKASSQKGPAWGDHHVPTGANEFIAGLLRRQPWISRIETRDAEGKSHAKKTVVRLGPRATGIPDIWITYVWDNFPAEFVVKTTARSAEEQHAALRAIEEEIG